jgi:transposase
MESLSVGVDIAKTGFVAAYWWQGQGYPLGSFPNTPAGFVALAQALRPIQAACDTAQIQLILEPTGGYELPLARFALQQDWMVSLPNPRHVRDWAKGVGRRAKTDPQDALLLARYGAERKPAVWHPLPAAVAELEELLRRKDDLEQMLRQERNRQDALRQRPGMPSAVPSSLERLIGALQDELAAIEDAIKQHLHAHAELRASAKRLRTVPGIGPKNVLWLLVLLSRWHTLTQGQGDSRGVVAYCGLDPQPYDSGTSVHKRATISRQGNSNVRRRLFLSALGGVRGQNVLRSFYQRLVGRGKAKKAALIAAARKILVWAWAVFRDHTTFDPAKVSRELAV